MVEILPFYNSVQLCQLVHTSLKYLLNICYIQNILCLTLITILVIHCPTNFFEIMYTKIKFTINVSKDPCHWKCQKIHDINTSIYQKCKAKELIRNSIKKDRDQFICNFVSSKNSLFKWACHNQGLLYAMSCYSVIRKMTNYQINWMCLHESGHAIWVHSPRQINNMYSDRIS